MYLIGRLHQSTFCYLINALLSSLLTYLLIEHCCYCHHSVFDASIDCYNVYKVETIGDAYMVASGLPTVNDHHAQEMSLLALEFSDSVKQLVVPHLPQRTIKLRIGLHSGSLTFTKLITKCLSLFFFLQQTYALSITFIIMTRFDELTIGHFFA